MLLTQGRIERPSDGRGDIYMYVCMYVGTYVRTCTMGTSGSLRRDLCVEFGDRIGILCVDL